jgi:hypothetical protein
LTLLGELALLVLLAVFLSAEMRAINCVALLGLDSVTK